MGREYRSELAQCTQVKPYGPLKAQDNLGPAGGGLRYRLPLYAT